MLNDFWLDNFWIAGAGLLAGAMNAAAGGGTFVTVPALIAAGVPSVAANMTSTLAMCPGAFASAYAFRNDFRDFSDASLRSLLTVSVVGGAVGAAALIVTPTRAFDAMIPWLLLLGAVSFAFGKQIGEWLRARMTLGRTALLATQFGLGVYAGYFGAAVGLMMLAAWTIFGARDLPAMIACRILIVGVSNAVAIGFFVTLGQIYWSEAAVMLVAGVIGGAVGAVLAKKVPVPQLRLGISVFNFAITAAFFWKTFL